MFEMPGYSLVGRREGNDLRLGLRQYTKIRRSYLCLKDINQRKASTTWVDLAVLGSRAVTHRMAINDGVT
jgi:hypothetical protein